MDGYTPVGYHGNPSVAQHCLGFLGWLGRGYNTYRGGTQTHSEQVNLECKDELPVCCVHHLHIESVKLLLHMIMSLIMQLSYIYGIMTLNAEKSAAAVSSCTFSPAA